MNRPGYIAFILLTALICTATYFRFNTRGQYLPEGCDQFGFLHMSEAISTGNLFHQHTERPFEGELIRHLENTGFQYREYAWAIAPHAYHTDAGSRKIINQYPPGTSLLLSLFGKHARQEYFAVIMIFLMVLIPAVVAYRLQPARPHVVMSVWMLFIMAAFAVISEPLLTEFGRINSVAPTYGLLLAAGIAVEKRPVLAAWLISLSCLFRIANILLIPPVLILALLNDRPFIPADREIYLRRGLKAMSVVLLGGFGMYLIYVYILLGNPLASTYSEIDQRSIGFDVIAGNVRFYFIENTGWLWLHVLTVIALLAFRWRKRISPVLFRCLLSLTPVVYLFFLFHFIKTSYYPYAPPLVVLGWLTYALPRIFTFPDTWLRPVWLVPAVIFLSIGVRSLIQRNNAETVSLSGQEALYKEAFTGQDVLWGDLRSGTFEYSTGKPGMRLTWGSPRAVKEVMTWLHEHGYRQAILLQDFPEGTEELLEKTIKNELPMTSETNSIFGRLIVIPGKQN